MADAIGVSSSSVRSRAGDRENLSGVKGVSRPAGEAGRLLTLRFAQAGFRRRRSVFRADDEGIRGVTTW
ncbi:hypothetical protein [Streptomyces virginiae]